MQEKGLNIGNIEMEFVRRALSKKVTISSGTIFAPIPNDSMNCSVGTCKCFGYYYDLQINLIIPDDNFLGLSSIILNPHSLVNQENVIINQNRYYLRCGELLICIGASSDTDMTLQIPIACTERSFKAKQKREHNHK